MKKIYLIAVTLLSTFTLMAQWSTNSNGIHYNSGNVGVGISSPSSLLHLKRLGTETLDHLTFEDGPYQLGTIKSLSGTDGTGLFFAAYTKGSVYRAQPALVLAGYAKDTDANDIYDAAVSVRGYNVVGNTTLSDLPIFKVLNGHSASYLTVNADGGVGIGTTTTGSHLLAVDGSIGAREVVVESGSWSDFVFDEGYNLPALKDVEKFIKMNNHLPEIPSEEEVVANGVNLGQMDAKLLQKIEELTLYLIDQDKRNSELTEKVRLLEERILNFEN